MPGEVRLGFADPADVVASVSTPEGQHDAQDSGKLVERYKKASELGGGQLSIVKRAVPIIYILAVLTGYMR